MKAGGWLAGILALAAGNLGAVTYTLAPVTFGGTASEAFGVNAAGEVVGSGRPVGVAFDRALRFGAGGATNLGTLGGNSSTAFAINDAGVVVGQSTVTGNAGTSAFVAFGGVMANLGTLAGGSTSSARGVNAAGVIVGYSDTATVNERAFRFQGGVMTDLGSLAGASGQSAAFDINDLGQIVGETRVPGGAQHGFLIINGAMADLDTLGGSIARASAVNNATHIVGYSNVTGNAAAHAFLNVDGITSDLGTLGGTTSAAQDINDRDQIVGYSQVAGGANHAFLYEGGVMKDLNPLVPHAAGWVLNVAYAINEAGQIAGVGTFAGQQTGFLLTPVAAPGLRVTGKKRLATTAARVTLRGTATGNVTRVVYRVGGAKAFRPARGLAKWKFTARVKPGRNRITILAQGPGGASAPAKVIVTRR